MRTTIKVEDGEVEVEADRGQEEAGDALREQRRRPNEGAAAAADETRSLRAAHAEAQAQAFREMEHARVMGLELMQEKKEGEEKGEGVYILLPHRQGVGPCLLSLLPQFATNKYFLFVG